MSAIETTMVLADLVDAHPELAGVLERRGLDFCCHGQRSLAEACRAEGLDPAAVAVELESALTGEPTGDWTAMGPVELVDHLEATHHRYLDDELPRLSALMDKVVSVHGERHPELAGVARILAELRADLEPHLLKEERVLFPMIRELATAPVVPTFHCGTLRNPIAQMLREHDTVGGLLADLRSRTGGYEAPADGCASYRALYAGLAALEADTHLHVHKENNALFPQVVALEAERARSRAAGA